MAQRQCPNCGGYRFRRDWTRRFLQAATLLLTAAIILNLMGAEFLMLFLLFFQVTVNGERLPPDVVAHFLMQLSLVGGVLALVLALLARNRLRCTICGYKLDHAQLVDPTPKTV